MARSRCANCNVRLVGFRYLAGDPKVNAVVAYFIGLFTIPAIATMWTGIDWAFSKTRGTGKCLVEWCEFEPMELGEHFNLTVWLRQKQHRWLSGRKHRKAVIAYWQSRKDRGLPINPYARKYLK